MRPGLPGQARSIEGQALNRMTNDLLIGGAIPSGELPFSLYEHSLEIVVRIVGFIPRRSVANFQVHDLFGSFIDQAMSIACASLEAGAHAGAELAVAFVGVKRRVPLKYVDK